MAEGARTAAETTKFRLELPCETASVPQARARVRGWCDELRIAGELNAAMQLAVTEAAANAVRHSGCDDFEVRGSTSGAALVSVRLGSGAGSSRPEPRRRVGYRDHSRSRRLRRLRGHSTWYARHHALLPVHGSLKTTLLSQAGRQPVHPTQAVRRDADPLIAVRPHPTRASRRLLPQDGRTRAAQW